MAITKTPNDALVILRKQSRFKDLADGSFAVAAINEAANRMWRDYEWPESLGEVPPFYLTPGESDVNPIAAPIPTDFAYLRDAWLLNPQGNMFELDVGRDKPRSMIESTPECVSYVPELRRWRVWPAPSTAYTAPLWQVEGRYKKTAPTWDVDDWGTTLLPWDDRYFRVYRKCLEYTVMDMLGRQEAGGVQFSQGRAVYSGKLAEYKDALADATRENNMYNGELFVSPEDGSLSLG